MADERADEIERLQHDGRVFRWSRRSAHERSGQTAAWPGHTTFVALRGGEVVVGDRYAGEGVERTYACDLPSLLDGCFQALVAEQLGTRVLEELLAEVRRELGVHGSSGPSRTPSTRNAREPGMASAAPGHLAATEASEASVVGSGAPAPAASPVVFARAQPGPTAAGGSERASEPAPVASASAAAGLVPTATRVDLTVVGCRSVSLPLAVALRGVTRTSMHELLGRLRALPCRVAAGVPRDQAEGLVARLVELGAEVELVPARPS
jgi:hypothetical protein